MAPPTRARRAQKTPQEHLKEAGRPLKAPRIAQEEDKDGNKVPEDPSEDIDDDDLCPICQMLLHEPVKTTCGHTLCNFCMATWASTSLAAPMTIVDVDEEPVPFDPVSDLEARCPMCRTLTTAKPDAQRSSALETKYPQAHLQRLHESSSSQLSRSTTSSIQTITVHIGNRHRLVPAPPNGPSQNQHDWHFFVQPSRTDIIEEVHIHLHPTFRQPHVVRTRPPYAISRLGWGFFTITASIILKAGYSWVSEEAEAAPDGAAKGALPLEWTLDFDGFGGKGSMGRCRLKVRNDKDWERVGREEARDERARRRMVRAYEDDGRYEPVDEE